MDNIIVYSTSAVILAYGVQKTKYIILLLYHVYNVIIAKATFATTMTML